MDIINIATDLKTMDKNEIAILEKYYNVPVPSDSDDIIWLIAMSIYKDYVHKRSHMYSGPMNAPIRVFEGEFENYWLKFIKLHPDLPIVSVGSGLGYIERYLEKTYRADIICVDPDPYSYQDNRYNYDLHLPDYPTIQDLLDDRPELFGKVKLFINHPQPDDWYGYDIDAIESTGAKLILLTCDLYCSSGSKVLHNWYEDIRDGIYKKYKLIEEDHGENDNVLVCVEYTIALVEKVE